MSIKSSSRLSTTQRSQVSHPSIPRSPRYGSSTRVGGSVVSLFGANRGSAAFRIGKGGFKVPRYQNTYRLEANNRFNPETVDKILETVMTETLTGVKYDCELCLKLVQDMSREVRSRIYKKDYDRYKYIVNITIVEKLGQAINQGMGRLWDVEKDTFCTYTFENTDILSVGTVYGIYYD